METPRSDAVTVRLARFAQGRGGAPPPTPPSSDSTPRVETAGEKEEKISQTSHAMRLDGREIKYTATTGTLPIRLDNGQVSARMFFVAYTRDGEDAKTRPVSFLYNGGPGAATIWLHMGSFAPRRVQMADEGFQPAPPLQLVDNEHSLLDVTDLRLRRRDRHRLQPRRRRRQQRAVPRRPRRPARVRRVHQQLPARRTAAGRRRNT